VLHIIGSNTSTAGLLTIDKETSRGRYKWPMIALASCCPNFSNTSRHYRKLVDRMDRRRLVQSWFQRSVLPHAHQRGTLHCASREELESGGQNVEQGYRPRKHFNEGVSSLVSLVSLV